MPVPDTFMPTASAAVEATVTFVPPLVNVPAAVCVRLPPISPAVADTTTLRRDVTGASIVTLPAEATSVTSEPVPWETIAPPVTVTSGAEIVIEPSAVVAPSTVRLEGDVKMMLPASVRLRSTVW